MKHAAAIRAFGDEGTKCAAALTEERGETVDRETVYKWRENDRIPPKYWRSFESAATRVGLDGITFHSLAMNYRVAA